MSSFGQNIVVLGGKANIGSCYDSVFLLDTSHFQFPSEITFANRNSSLRSAGSESPLPLFELPYSYEPKSPLSPTLASQSSTPAPHSTPLRSAPPQIEIPAFSVSIPSESPPVQTTPEVLINYDPGPSRRELVSPLSNPTLQKSPTLPSFTPMPDPRTSIQSEGFIPSLSIDTTSLQWSSVTSRTSSPISPAPTFPQSMTTSQSKISTWLIDSVEEEPFPPSLDYTPPHDISDSELLRFLKDECETLSYRFKIKQPSEPARDRESHFAVGNNNDIEYQRHIDSGTNSDVFQVLTKIKTMPDNRCFTRNHTRYAHSLGDCE